MWWNLLKVVVAAVVTAVADYILGELADVSKSVAY